MTSDSRTTPAPSPRSRRRRLLGLIVIDLAAALVALELGLRLLHGRNAGINRLLYMPGAQTAYDDLDTLPELLGATTLGFAPFEARGDRALSSRSLRTKEFTREKPAGTFRVLAFGDSFTFASGGVPFESLWHRWLERRLAERASADVEVLNLGVPAIGTDFQYRLWQVEGRALDADLVILAFFVGNDFHDVGGAAGDATLGARIARRSLAARLFRNLRTLHGSGAAPREVMAQTSDSSEDPDRAATYAYDPLRGQFAQDAYDTLEYHRMLVCDPERTEQFERCFEAVEDVLIAFATEAREAGVPFALMLIPDEFQVDREVRNSALASRGRAGDALDLERPQRALRALCEAHAIPCLDLLPAFRSAEGRLYALRDTHWNEQGNALAGERLAEFLRSAELVPPDR